MKPKKAPRKRTLSVEQLPTITNYYARQYQGLLSTETTNIFLIKRIKEFGVPHKNRSQYVYSKGVNGIIVATDAKNHKLADWIEYMDDYIISHWENPDPVEEPILITKVSVNKDGTVKKKAGRKPGTIMKTIDTERKLQIIKAIRHNQKTKRLTQYELEGRLGISASYLSQMKKKYLTSYWFNCINNNVDE